MNTPALLDACANGDHQAMERHGWRPVMDALRYWKKRLTGEELAPYAQLLGDENPDHLVAVLQHFAREGEEWRPAPAMILQRLHPVVVIQPDRRSHPRMDQTEHAHHMVRTYTAAGDQVCRCRPRSAQINMDPDGVLRCPDCAGLEPGQHDQAHDL